MDGWRPCLVLAPSWVCQPAGGLPFAWGLRMSFGEVAVAVLVGWAGGAGLACAAGVCEVEDVGVDVAGVLLFWLLATKVAHVRGAAGLGGWVGTAGGAGAALAGLGGEAIGVGSGSLGFSAFRSSVAAASAAGSAAGVSSGSSVVTAATGASSAMTTSDDCETPFGKGASAGSEAVAGTSSSSFLSTCAMSRCWSVAPSELGKVAASASAGCWGVKPGSAAGSGGYSSSSSSIKYLKISFNTKYPLNWGARMKVWVNLR